MKRKIKIVIFTTLIAFTIISVKANAVSDKLELTEFSEEYKNYLNLSEEEREKVIEPSRYSAYFSTGSSELVGQEKNILKSITSVRNSLTPSYDLQSIIPNNVLIRNQYSINACWAFASIGALETNLALQDYHSGNTSKIYDFSERHMIYGIIKDFKNNQTNKYGFTRKIADGGNFYHAETYLSNGMGAINEADMPYENNMNELDISEIQNKQVTSTLYDTVVFEDVDDIGKDALILKMKQHISTYGGLYTAIHGAQLLSDAYNNNTGAIYCSSSTEFPIDHGVTIIGWDDNYSKDNFNEKNKPANNGAWIIKNSWGEEIRTELTEVKQKLYESHTAELNEMGIYSPEDITDEFILAVYKANYGTDKVTLDNNELVIEVGNNGYMYISYNDANVYSELFGIEKATSTKDYDHIYQYDLLGSRTSFKYDDKVVYLANKFTRDASKEELLDKVSVYTIQEGTYKVYVNADNGNFSELKEVRTKSGDSITLKPGYHTIELDTPISLTGNTFIVALRAETDDENTLIMTECKLMDENVECGKDESFFTSEAGFQLGQWQDWNDATEAEANGNISIKAFTKEVKEDAELEKIEIIQAPNKINYIEGEDFSTEGMRVLATYSDSSEKEITNYEITDGKNLSIGQTKVTISYTENGITKTTEQSITVTEQAVNLVKIEITKAPNKINYSEGEDFSAEGMEVIATYSDSSEKEITNYEITDGKNLSIGQTKVTVSYTENGITKTAEQSITVTKQAVELVKIEITKAPNKVEYIEGENFSAEGMVVVATYSDSSEKEITNYEVLNGGSLELDQTKVTISYTENGITKTTEQSITVIKQEEGLVSIKITQAPNKVEYIEGENFSTEGMKVVATYSDSSEKEITDYEVLDGENLNVEQTKVTISYTEDGVTRTAEQNITVTKNEEPEEQQPQLSNLKDMKIKIDKVKAYFYKEIDETDYIDIELTLSNIEHGNKETNYTYYYYLSTNDSEENIQDWIKINSKENNTDDGKTSITFNINTKDLPNSEELANAERVYLYIKEVANIGDTEVEQTKTEVLKVDSNTSLEFYIDNELIGTIDDVIDDEIKIESPDKNGSSNNSDGTTAGGILPQTGVLPIGVLIAVLVGIGIWKYIRYKRMCK